MDVNTANNNDYIGSVLLAIQKKINEKKSSVSIEDIFYDVMEDVVGRMFQDRKYDFITYINIWNQTEKGNLGKIEFYADHFNQPPITKNREDIKGINRDLFDKNYSIPISYIFRKNRVFGASFCIQLNNDDIGADIVDYSCQLNTELPEELKLLVDKVGVSEREGFGNWVKTIDHCYGKNDNTTHFFFYNGSIYYGKNEEKTRGDGKESKEQKERNLENSLAEYVLYANIGIHIDDESTEKKRFVYSFLRRIRKLIEQISFNLIVDIKDYQMHQAAVRAAIAQVMARNMSHNFGSHVISNLVGDGVYEKLDDEAVKKLKYFNPKETDEVYKDLYKALEEPEKPGEYNKSKNHQLQYFFQYLKSRMDYLSEVTLGVPNLLTTKMMYGDVMKELDQVRILLNYISGVSNFKYRFKLMIVENGEMKEITAENDIAVAFPSDVLGCHAFYNIIENIIRNTAKHARNTGDVTFTITFKDVDGQVCEDIEEAAELYCVEIDNGVYEDGIDELVNKQNDRLNQSVLENNNLRGNSLGLLEMEASAAFLRQIDLPEIESDDYLVDHNNNLFHERNHKKRLNILKAFAIDEKEVDRENEEGKTISVKTGRLGYRFFVQKPKEFLFVGNWDIGDVKKKELLNLGIQFISAHQFMTDLEKEKAFAHQFLVYDSTQCQAVRKMLEEAQKEGKIKEVKEQMRSYNTLLPLRKIRINNSYKPELTKSWVGDHVLQNLKIWAWDKYYEDVMVQKEGVPPLDILIVTDYDENEIGKNQIVFLDHGYESRHKTNCEKKQNNKKTEIWIENLLSRTYGKLPDYSEWSSGFFPKPIVNYFFNLIALEIDKEAVSKRKKMLRQNIFEAYHNKVIILDERVQKFAENHYEGSAAEGEKLIPCWKLFRSTNVYIPRPPQFDERGNPLPMKNWIDQDLDGFEVFSLDPNDFGENKNKVKFFVDFYSKEYHPKSQSFILVHYGVLERMCGGNVKEINELLEQWVKMAKRVVVTSGRGAHSLDLPKSVCFVNLSSVLYTCNENRNKYLINYLLNQSRRKRNE